MSHHSSRFRIFGWLALVAWLPLLLLQSFPNNQVTISQSAFLSAHAILEITAIAIAALIFFIAYGARDALRSRRVLILGCFFLATALFDTIHTLSYPGMPDFITSNSTEKMIWFWLLARLTAGLGLLFYALQPDSPSVDYQARLPILIGSLLIVVLISAAVLLLPDSLPTMHIPGQGLTPLKIGFEWLICGLYLLSALVLYRHRLRVSDYDVTTLILALLLMAAAELFFTLYVQVSSTANLIGHIYKVIAYYFLYRAIFAEAVGRPFLQIAQLNNELKYQRDFATSIVNTAPMIILMLDPQGRIQHVNPYFETLTGYRLNEIKDKDWFTSFILPEQQGNIRELFAHALHQQPTRGNINPILTRDGETRAIEWHDQIMHDADGQVTSLLVVGQDVTDRIHANEVLRVSEERLREAQALAHVGHWEIDLDADKSAWSDEQYRLLGYAPHSLTPGLESFLEAVHPDDRQSVRAAMQRAMRNDGDGMYQLEHRVIHPQGVRILAQHGQVIFDDQGQAKQFFGTSMDITERKLAEYKLQQLNEELEERVRQRTADMQAAKEAAEHANTAKSEFLSRMSHELRTPLNAILGFGQLLESDPQYPLSAIQADNVQEILHAGQHLLEMVNEILDLSRIESGRLELSLETVAITALLESSVRQLSPLATQRNIQIELQVQDNCVVKADHTRLKQVFINLLSNAIKYNRDGGSIRIRCHSTQHGLVHIAFQDSGFGIPEASLPRLFRPFERLETAYHGIEGSGIGLALAKNLVDAMHGHIGVESTVEVGSTFWLELPAAKLADTGQEPFIRNDTNIAPPLQGLHRVLYVEDNPANLRLIRKIVSTRSDIQILEAETAEQGLEMAIAQQPDLILLDINLPGMDGFSALVKLRSHPHTADIPVVAVTANAMKRDIARGQAAGFNDYLTKPIDVSRFLQLLDRMLTDTTENEV